MSASSAYRRPQLVEMLCEYAFGRKTRNDRPTNGISTRGSLTSITALRAVPRPVLAARRAWQERLQGNPINFLNREMAPRVVCNAAAARAIRRLLRG